MDEHNAKTHTQLKKHLSDPPNSLILDDEFENLYISKKSNGIQDLEIISQVVSFYAGLKRNKIYDELLQIGFKAIISYTSDLFLFDANQPSNDYDFFAFSKKGVDNSPRDEEQNLSKKPVIYNIFGDIRDTNTLIINYDSLYDFFLNIIKAEKEFPLQLRNIMSQSTAFLFLGFDLSKWYVPLIIRKLNQFIRINNINRVVSGFVCLDDTPIKADKLNEAHVTEEIKESLNKYPLLFKHFKASSIELIDSLYALPRNSEQDQPVQKDRPPTAEERKFFEGWKEDCLSRGANESLDVFFNHYKTMKYEAKSKSQFFSLSMAYYQNRGEKAAQMISAENYNVKMQHIIQSLISTIDNLI